MSPSVPIGASSGRGRATARLSYRWGRPPTAADLRAGSGEDYYEPGTWGVYFCRPSALPRPLAPYRTDQRLAVRDHGRPFEARVEERRAFVLRADGCSEETFLAGLGQEFAAEADVWEDLRRVAHVPAPRQAIATYPWPVFLVADHGAQDYRTTLSLARPAGAAARPAGAHRTKKTSPPPRMHNRLPAAQ